MRTDGGCKGSSFGAAEEVEAAPRESRTLNTLDEHPTEM